MSAPLEPHDPDAWYIQEARELHADWQAAHEEATQALLRDEASPVVLSYFNSAQRAENAAYTRMNDHWRKFHLYREDVFPDA